MILTLQIQKCDLPKLCYLYKVTWVIQGFSGGRAWKGIDFTMLVIHLGMDRMRPDIIDIKSTFSGWLLTPVQQLRAYPFFIQN